MPASASTSENCVRAWRENLIQVVQIFLKKISVVCHRYQLHEYKMGNVYVGCRTINKPEDYATPKLSKSKLRYMAEER